MAPSYNFLAALGSMPNQRALAHVASTQTNGNVVVVQSAFTHHRNLGDELSNQGSGVLAMRPPSR